MKTKNMIKTLAGITLIASGSIGAISFSAKNEEIKNKKNVNTNKLLTYRGAKYSGTELTKILNNDK
ncbi:hypothetical protein [Mycoplasma nasistruthionis]|uniref:Uncharacterized protein n=1 Tax=Mycoplasma nasistruthionis TaxID=353852 RepID=A0A4Y6I5X3_9MOLU|nr:hypothetical protein [Mycoplasma nasistruthionis]QDF65016.1 hypothetical protein FIV53_01735 [Mycoplasma nasistruthionis]